ncbi:DMT family transporter [Terasakiella sp.]|uniref:DMT family transporter n=1 Tax=Terasakiella sp. TaxID=2034861 RepID=UPI003AA98CB3
MRRNQIVALPTLSPQALAMIALFFGVACFSVGNVITRFADVGPTASAFYRLFFAMPMMWGWGMIFFHSPAGTQRASVSQVSWRTLAPYGIACGLFLGGEVALLHHAYIKGSVGVAIFLNNFAPLFVILGAWVFLKERPGKYALLCLVCAAPGAFFMSGLDPVNGVVAMGEGSIEALLSAVCYAGFLLCGTRMRRYCSSKTVVNWTNATAILMLAPLAIFNQEILIAQSWEGWAVLVAIAFVSQVLGMNLYIQSMGVLSSTFVSFFSLSQPIMTMILAWWVLGETLTGLQMIGAVIILLALGVNNLAPKKVV